MDYFLFENGLFPLKIFFFKDLDIYSCIEIITGIQNLLLWIKLFFLRYYRVHTITIW